MQGTGTKFARQTGGVHRCHLCGSTDLEPNPAPHRGRDRRVHLICRDCGTAVNITHWIVHRGQWWAEVTYVTENGRPSGKVLLFAAPLQPGRPRHTVIPDFMFPVKRGRAGLTPDEIAFAIFKLKQPNLGPDREGRLHITPRVIQDEKELQEVQAQVDALLGKDCDAYQELYLSYLGDLIFDWEEEHEKW